MAEARKRNTPTASEKPATKASSAAAPSPGGSGLSLVNIGFVLVTIIGAGLYYYASTKPNAVETSSSAAAANRESSPAIPSAVTGRVFTDTELRAYDGTDSEKPIYLAINGTIFDVSSGRGFYGPGGHYGHFAGRDATRAWVTECWDTEDQLTHDMRGIEEMFMPRYMDEELADVAEGRGSVEVPENLRQQAQERLKAFGGAISAKEQAARREADKAEALESVQAALGHWVGFFSNSGKYPVVGTVKREAGWEKSAPAPPAICEKALKKRPFKGGKLQSIMDAKMSAGNSQPGAGAGSGGNQGAMPDFVKQKLAAKGKAS